MHIYIYIYTNVCVVFLTDRKICQETEAPHPTVTLQHGGGRKEEEEAT